jgi:hypothetical protein
VSRLGRGRRHHLYQDDDGNEGGADVAESGDSSDSVKCSFCDKNPKQVGKLIAGPGVYICNECIALCNDIIEEEGLAQPEAMETVASSPTNDQRKWRAAHDVVSERLGRRPTVAELAEELGWTDDQVTDAGRGTWVATGTPATGPGPASLGDGLRRVQRQLDQLARHIAVLVEQADAGNSPE